MTFDPSLARKEIPALRTQAQFNAGTFGPTPQRVATAMQEHMEGVLHWGRNGKARLHQLHEHIHQARRSVAASFDIPLETVALTHCTTDGINTVLRGLRWEPGDEVVTTTAEHPGLTSPLESLCLERGVLAHAVAPSYGALSAALSPKTKLLAISHVLWTTGETLPIQELVREARKIGARVLIDGAQSAGAIPVKIVELGADFYTISGQKWLCGPSGTGALYIHPDALSSLSTPWPSFLSKNRSGAITKEWPTAQRLDVSTLSTTSLTGMAAALSFHREHVERGALPYAHALANTLRQRLREMPAIRVIETTSPSTLVSFTKDGAKAEEVSAALEQGNVFVRPIPGLGYIRASVGFWNDTTDIDRLVTALR